MIFTCNIGEMSNFPFEMTYNTKAAAGAGTHQHKHNSSLLEV